MVIALGNSPSSGSTFLADLLDSTDITAVGPELNLFGLRQLYDFKNFKSNPYNDRSCSLYKYRHQLFLKNLSQYGLDEFRYEEIIKNSKSTSEFLKHFKNHYLSLRGKDLNSILFEKSPININAIDEYFKSYGEYFIHIVRNPLNVYKSFKKRDVPERLALINWLIDEAKVYPYFKNKKLIIIKYEDLVNNPYQIISELVLKIKGVKISPLEIEKKYVNNAYRKYHGYKLATWTSTKTSEVINANEVVFCNEDIEALSMIWNLKVSKKYANIFNLPEVSFQQIIKDLGYYDELKGLVSANSKYTFRLDGNSRKKLFMKWSSDYRNNDAGLSDITSYLNPVSENIQHVLHQYG
jgi:hypothetical protein